MNNDNNVVEVATCKSGLFIEDVNGFSEKQIQRVQVPDIGKIRTYSVRRESGGLKDQLGLQSELTPKYIELPNILEIELDVPDEMYTRLPCGFQHCSPIVVDENDEEVQAEDIITLCLAGYCEKRQTMMSEPCEYAKVIYVTECSNTE